MNVVLGPIRVQHLVTGRERIVPCGSRPTGSRQWPKASKRSQDLGQHIIAWRSMKTLQHVPRDHHGMNVGRWKIMENEDVSKHQAAQFDRRLVLTFCCLSLFGFTLQYSNMAMEDTLSSLFMGDFPSETTSPFVDFPACHV